MLELAVGEVVHRRVRLARQPADRSSRRPRITLPRSSSALAEVRRQGPPSSAFGPGHAASRECDWVRVRILPEAEDDLVATYQYVAQHDGIERAEAMLDRLERAVRSLDRLTGRGRVPPELAAIGVADFRESIAEPYRIVYEVAGHTVHIHAVLDGRRDLTDLLSERLLR